MIFLVDSEEEQSDTAAFQAALDINRFRRLIREAEQEHSVAYDPPHIKGVAKSIASNMKHHGICSYIIYYCMTWCVLFCCEKYSLLF